MRSWRTALSGSRRRFPSRFGQRPEGWPMVVGFSPVSATALNARKSDLISLFVRKTDCSHEKLPPLLKTQSICHNPTRKSDGFFLDKTAEEKIVLSQTRYG
jgi:hypothetical protein